MHNYEEGDIVYSQENGKYYVSKIVKIEQVDGKGVWHRIMFKPAEHLPDASEVDKLDVAIWHVPQAAKPDAVTFLVNQPVKPDDLKGYNTYLDAQA